MPDQDRLASMTYELRAELVAEQYPRDGVGRGLRNQLMNRLVAEALAESDLEAALAVIVRFYGDISEEALESFRAANREMDELERAIRLDPDFWN